MLDVSIRLEVLDLLEELRRDLHLAVLYITHDIASARYFADEILVMYAGEIVERGPAEALTQHPAHPYTQLLVRLGPRPRRVRRAACAGPRRERPSRGGRAPSCAGLPICGALPAGGSAMRRADPAAAGPGERSRGGLLAPRRLRAVTCPVTCCAGRSARTGGAGDELSLRTSSMCAICAGFLAGYKVGPPKEPAPPASPGGA